MKATGIICLLLTVCGVLHYAAADSTVRTNSPQQKEPLIKTNFEDDAKLTEQDVKHVIALAQQCGIAQPAEIRTFHYLPSAHRGISVKSAELVKGMDITFDEIYLKKTDWEDSKPEVNDKKAGQFWATPADKYTTHLRVYDFRGEKIRVQLWDGITTELADKIIPLIAAKKVHYADNEHYGRDELKKMIDVKPSGISEEHDGKFRLHLSDRLDVVRFRFEKGELVLEQVIHIVI